MQSDEYDDAGGEAPVMKNFTLRNIPPEIASAVRRRAAEKGLSVSKAVLDLVAEGAGLNAKSRKKNSDFDGLFGQWSKEEADAFDRHLREIRKIDPEVWK
jgi:superfamily I DNA/RNA helicase